MRPVANTVVAVSDLHMSASTSLGIFDAAEEFVDFLCACAKEPQRLDLLMLGDALDFLTVEPYLALREAVAVAKARRIIRVNRPVFAALRCLAQTPGKRIVWLIGNHDLELVFPRVRRTFNRAILGQQYDDADRLLWCVDGAGIEYRSSDGRARIKFVHGNQADLWNAWHYDLARLRDCRCDQAESSYPSGSVLVADVLNPLKSKKSLNHIDLLKPEVQVALPLTLALWPDATLRLLPKAWKIAAAAAIRRLRGATQGRPPSTFGAFDGDESVETPTFEREQLIAAAVHGALATGSDVDPSDLAELLEEDAAVARHMARNLAGVDEEPPVFGDARAFRILESLILAAAGEANGRSNPWALDEPDLLHTWLKGVFAASSAPDLVVAGHTHLARAIPYASRLYLNVGTWANLMRIPRAIRGTDFLAYANRLKEGIEQPATAAWDLRPFRRLTYARIDLDPRGSGDSFGTALLEWPSECTGVLCRHGCGRGDTSARPYG